MPIDVLHSDIQEALRETSPLLSSVQLANTITYYGTREPGSFSGYYGWAKQSIKYKMANYRTKFRGFGVPELQDEFRRITTVHLESKFMSKLDEYTPKLLVLFHSKGEALGLRLQAILLKETARSPFCEATLRFELHAHGFPLHPVRVAVLHADDHDTDSDRPDMLYWSYLLEAETEDRSHQETGQAR
ncbi:hypothetical protein AOLI_G00241950 [Acnodon oligacanthus]